MAIPGSLMERIAEALSRDAGRHIDIEQALPIGGGLHEGYRIDTDAGRFFAKVNSFDRYPSLFEAEADGLRLLRSAGALPVPRPIAFGEDHDDGFLLLEWVEPGPAAPDFEERLGHGLARLHRRTSPRFGYPRDNYIGTLRQSNATESTWPGFFIRQRLEPQLELALRRKRLGTGIAFRFERLFARLPDLFPAEPPALLHGDLWHGNVLCDTAGAPWLIDPAVYYGHREMDVAMMLLFGGSAERFIQAYQAAWPLEPGWRDRVAICNLYPLLVHTNLFGGAYGDQVASVLARYA